MESRAHKRERVGRHPLVFENQVSFYDRSALRQPGFVILCGLLTVHDSPAFALTGWFKEGNDDGGFPMQKRGVTNYPGLYFCGTSEAPQRKSGLLRGAQERFKHHKTPAFPDIDRIANEMPAGVSLTTQFVLTARAMEAVPSRRQTFFSRTVDAGACHSSH